MSQNKPVFFVSNCLGLPQKSQGPKTRPIGIFWPSPFLEVQSFLHRIPWLQGQPPGAEETRVVNQSRDTHNQLDFLSPRISLNQLCTSCHYELFSMFLLRICISYDWGFLGLYSWGWKFWNPWDSEKIKVYGVVLERLTFESRHVQEKLNSNTTKKMCFSNTWSSSLFYIQ